MIGRKYETIVGIFVLASLAALSVMVLIIAQQEGLWQERVEYRAVFKNISGLKKGSEVRLAGVTVGNVKDITIGPKGEILVTFEVLEKYRDQVRQDSRATIGYIGLLGDRSLDMTAGSPDQPAIPPEGQVIASEPLDFTEIITRATPYLEKLQKLLNNLVIITDFMKEEKANFQQVITGIRSLVDKTNQGKGSLGLLINDPVLYQNGAQALASANKVIDSLQTSQGLIGTLLHDQAFSAEARKALSDLNAVIAGLKRTSRPLEEAAARLPSLAKKAETFLDNLDRASTGLPDLVVTGQDLVSDADKVAEAAQKSWLLRRHIPQPRERTIRVEKDIK